MTRSLVFKLVLAFLVVSVTGAVLTTLFARWATFREFDHLVLEQAQNNFLANATAYYQTNGSWLGVREYFHRLAEAPAPQLRSDQRPPLPQPQPEDRTRPAQQPRSYVFAVADQDGRVVLPAGPYRLGNYVSADELAQSVGIEVDGQVVGEQVDLNSAFFTDDLDGEVNFRPEPGGQRPTAFQRHDRALGTVIPGQARPRAGRRRRCGDDDDAAGLFL